MPAQAWKSGALAPRKAEKEIGASAPASRRDNKMPAAVTTEPQMFINNEFVPAHSTKTFPVYDPSTEEIIAQVPDAGPDDVNRAVVAAKAAFEEGPWSTTTAQERGRVLFRLSEKIRAN